MSSDADAQTGGPPAPAPAPSPAFVFAPPADAAAAPSPSPFVFGAPAGSAPAPFVFNAGVDTFAFSPTGARSNDYDRDRDESDDERGPQRARRSAGGRNPFQDEVKKRNSAGPAKSSSSHATATPTIAAATTHTDAHADDDQHEDDGDGDEEEGEDDEDAEDDEDEMDEDDEGDTPYPHWDPSPTTVACEQCGEYIPRTALAQHEREVCSETPMECQFAHLHCGATAVNRRLLRAHLSRNMPDHVVWLMDRVTQLTEQLHTLTDSLHTEVSRRMQLERLVEETSGRKITQAGTAHETPRRGGVSGAAAAPASRMLRSAFSSSGREAPASSGKRGSGASNVSFSPLPSSYSASHSPPATGGRHGHGAHRDAESFRLSSEPVEPLAVSENRWTPHSIPTNTAAPPSQALFPTAPVAGSGNSASEAQTRLKVAAGLLPASALQAFQSPALASPAPPPVSSASSSPLLVPASAIPGVDDLSTLTKQLKSVLNKLSGTNFDKLSVQIISILRTVNSPDTLTALVSLLFDKAVLDQFFANIYSMLCAEISAKLPPLHSEPKHAFKRFLLNQCQVEFESGTSSLVRLADESDDAFVSRKSRQKARLLGTIRFLGELYLRDLILQNIMIFCVNHLLPHLEWSRASECAPAAPVVDSALLDAEKCDSIEAFCKLLVCIGAKLDSSDDGKKLLTDSVFPAIARAEHDGAMPSRLRFMLKDLAELRSKLRWKPRTAAAQAVATSDKITSTADTGGGAGSGHGHAQQPRSQSHAAAPSSGHSSSSSGRGAVSQSPADFGGLRISSSTNGQRTVSSSSSHSHGHAHYTHHDSHAQHSVHAAPSSGGRRGGGDRDGGDRNRKSAGPSDGRGGRMGSGGGRSGGGGVGGGSRPSAHPLDSRFDDDADDDRNGRDAGQWTRGERGQQAGGGGGGHSSGRKSGGGGGGGGGGSSSSGGGRRR